MKSLVSLILFYAQFKFNILRIRLIDTNIQSKRIVYFYNSFEISYPDIFNDIWGEWWWQAGSIHISFISNCTTL